MAWFRNFMQISNSRSYFSQRTQPLTSLNTCFTALSRFTTESSALQDQTINPDQTSLQHDNYSGLRPTKHGEKPRVVVLGSGWAGCRLMKELDTDIYDVVCVSPRNHMVFTPLLASTCVGTLEFRSVAEPIGRIQPAISTAPGSYFFLANCTGVDAEKHLVS